MRCRRITPQREHGTEDSHRALECKAHVAAKVTCSVRNTVKMRPDIDYSIEPRTFQTSLLTENFKPATITYWDYYRARPLYVRLASGAPLASEADVYVSAFNKDRGYAMAYINHWGDYRNRINMAEEKVS